MKKIELSGKYMGTYFYIDDDVYDLVSMFKWYGIYRNKTIYVRNMQNDENHKPKCFSLHRYVAVLYGLLKTMDDRVFIDHIDRNPLNNRKSNLRVVSNAENQRNQKFQGGSSRFKGVSWHKNNKKWESRITFNKKLIYLGSFDNEVDAALKYDCAARNFGYLESVLNFPVNL